MSDGPLTWLDRLMTTRLALLARILWCKLFGHKLLRDKSVPELYCPRCGAKIDLEEQERAQ